MPPGVRRRNCSCLLTRGKLCEGMHTLDPNLLPFSKMILSKLFSATDAFLLLLAQ